MNEEKVEQLLSTLERLEKAGELKKFLKEVPEISREELWKSTVIPPVLEGLKKMHDFCMVELSLHLFEIEKEMAWVNYYTNYCKNIYDGYAANRENIKNPEILNFMKDYEEYYIIKEEEKEEECKKK